MAYVGEKGKLAVKIFKESRQSKHRSICLKVTKFFFFPKLDFERQAFSASSIELFFFFVLQKVTNFRV